MDPEQIDVQKSEKILLSCGCIIKDQTAELETMCKQHTEAYFMS